MEIVPISVNSSQIRIGKASVAASKVPVNSEYRDGFSYFDAKFFCLDFKKICSDLVVFRVYKPE